MTEEEESDLALGTSIGGRRAREKARGRRTPSRRGSRLSLFYGEPKTVGTARLFVSRNGSGEDFRLRTPRAASRDHSGGGPRRAGRLFRGSLFPSQPHSHSRVTFTMSSFRRRITTTPIPGSRPSPYNSQPLLSTGLSSLDDILGGGLPLSSSLLLESDTPTAYANLLLKFFIAQGLECKQEVVVVASGLEGGPEELVGTLMGVEGGSSGVESEEDEGDKAAGEKLKIAFRYEGMKQHAVTIPAPACGFCYSTGTRGVS